ncbi:Deoxyuridine 5'-triphosphate nucleotidohydrolase [Candidatus Xenohaliotis californiensis]|uniref:Deoxyuridine 5'-triphosphate nucleotidohydrolase n=1 Tax=Candidatus Xenohaliotis californiensis TaxID=84677 RepID=A0ABM9N9R2_9RICK|nr:Deoxyuridine 5'-triphosphate nucleotidohydrolase [Candidatus Xenohaliotis californiensis]
MSFDVLTKKKYVEVFVNRVSNSVDLPLPTYATSQSAGVDLMADITTDITIKPGDVAVVPTGIAIQIPANYEAQIRSRSGIAFKHSVIVLNSPATIDADYRGELKIILKNLGKNDFIISRGMRIAQLLVKEVPTIKFILKDSLSSSERGDKGFGSTGL